MEEKLVELFIKSDNVSKKKGNYILNADGFYLIAYTDINISLSGGFFNSRHKYTPEWHIKYKSFKNSDEINYKISESDYLNISAHCKKVIEERIKNQINSELNK